MALRHLAPVLVVLSVAGCKKEYRAVDLTYLSCNQGVCVAIGQQTRGENTRGLALRSVDGETWGEVVIPATGILTMVAPNQAGFIAVGSTSVTLPDEAAALLTTTLRAKYRFDESEGRNR
ncbi:MAG: hypothetical protein EOO75_11540, partial [Myxococcales bacterium]